MSDVEEERAAPAAVAALAIGVFAASVLTALGTAAAGMRPVLVVTLALLVPIAASALLAVQLLAAVALSQRRERREAVRPEPVRLDLTAAEGGSLAEREARRTISVLAGRLSSLQDGGAAVGAAQLMPVALALHQARLRLAEVILVERGVLPQSLKDELLRQHRAVQRLLEGSLPGAEGPLRRQGLTSG